LIQLTNLDLNFIIFNNSIENLLNHVINQLIKSIINKYIIYIMIHKCTLIIFSTIKDILKQLKEPYKYNYLDDLIFNSTDKRTIN
jgi:hypothetical protein